MDRSETPEPKCLGLEQRNQRDRRSAREASDERPYHERNAMLARVQKQKRPARGRHQSECERPPAADPVADHAKHHLPRRRESEHHAHDRYRDRPAVMSANQKFDDVEESADYRESIAKSLRHQHPERASPKRFAYFETRQREHGFRDRPSHVASIRSSIQAANGALIPSESERPLEIRALCALLHPKYFSSAGKKIGKVL